MQRRFMRFLLPAALPLAIAACGEQVTAAATPAPAPALAPAGVATSAWPTAIEQIESAALLADTRFGDRVVASKQQGLQLLGQGGEVLAALPGSFGAVDSRSGDGLLIAAVDLDRQQAVVTTLANGKLREPVALPKRAFKIDGLCLHRDRDHDYLFLVGEEGLGEQWLVAQQGAPLPAPLRVRGLSLPPGSEHCQVDDATARLFVNEENVGLWAYAADAEADLVREPVALRQPFGDIQGLAAGTAVAGGGVLLLDPEQRLLHRYRHSGNGWLAEAPLQLAALDEPEALSARITGDSLQLLLRDDNGLHEMALAWLPPAPATAPALPVVTPRVQSEPVPSLGDAADDPALWLHPQQPARSRVVATDKQGGVVVYDLAGRTLQDLRVGRINNVDVRPGFRLGDAVVDLAVGSNRDRNSLHLFAIDRTSGELRDIGQVETPLREIYGLCLFRAGDGAIHAFANDKDGTFLQYRLDGSSGQPQGELVRRFAVQTQPEGCVADDSRQRLFIGEEGVAVWALDARADAPAELAQVIAAGAGVEADIEGLAIYRAAGAGDAVPAYLVISSQGNDSYVVLDAEPPFARRGAFRIGPNAASGIDGVSETDGLDVTAADLGGAWSRGLLVVQDGRKRMPEGSQNYKYVAWSDVVAALGLD